MRTSEFTNIPVKFRLASLIFLVIAGQIFSTLVVMVILWTQGYGFELDFQQWINDGQTGQIRMVLASGQIFGFLFPGLLYLWMIYKTRSMTFVMANQKPALMQLITGFFFLLASLPLVYTFLFRLIKKFPCGMLR